jgi:hypothetical protein
MCLGSNNLGHKIPCLDITTSNSLVIQYSPSVDHEIVLHTNYSLLIQEEYYVRVLLGNNWLRLSLSNNVGANITKWQHIQNIESNLFTNELLYFCDDDGNICPDVNIRNLKYESYTNYLNNDSDTLAVVSNIFYDIVNISSQSFIRLNVSLSNPQRKFSGCQFSFSTDADLDINTV